MTLEEQMALQKFHDMFMVDEDDHCQVGVLWKSGERSLRNNYHAALKKHQVRLRVDKNRDPEGRKAFNAKIRTYRNLKVIREATHVKVKPPTT